jgi:hypothetical protein
MAYLLDDFQHPNEVSRFGTRWFIFSDQVMGGCSSARAHYRQHNGLRSLCFEGQVSLENQGGFIQLALPLVHSRYLFDARHFQGVHLRVKAEQREGWYLHLRTRELSMPWQHYRAAFFPTTHWQTLEIPFELFYPIGTNHPLNLERLTRIGIVAGQQDFEAQLELREIGFYPG